jgi:hypothetical protein
MRSNVFLFGNLLAVVGLLAACSPNSQESATQDSNSHSTTATEQQPEAIATSANDLSPIFFDDFSYRDMAAFNQNGWKARTETGHPGIAGATWSAEGIAFLESLEGAENGAVRMSSVTGGSGENTRHTQFCHARKYREGTYAARVFFRDQPTFGPDGDEVIQTFYAISPLKAPMDKDYSETDFEYLPNGGWGEPNDPAMWTTSWDTFQLEPWTKVNEYTRVAGSYAGWHTLVLTVADNKVTYFVDGKLFSEHSNAVYPEDFMSMNFNLWFMPKGADGSQGPVDSTKLREYQEDIDWAFHMAGRALSTAEVETLVTDFRKNKVAYIDRVAEQNPPLPSPCGL